MSTLDELARYPRAEVVAVVESLMKVMEYLIIDRAQLRAEVERLRRELARVKTEAGGGNA